MPKLIEERWEGVSWVVTRETIQRANQDGPMTDAEGMPMMVDLWILTLVMDSPGGRHILKVPFDDESRQKLLQQFAGGVIIPGNGSSPHLPFGRGV